MEEENLSFRQWLKDNKENVGVGIVLSVALIGIVGLGINSALDKRHVSGRSAPLSFEREMHYSAAAPSSKMMAQEVVMASADMGMSIDSVSNFVESSHPAGRKIQETHNLDFVTSRAGVQELYDETLSLCRIDFCETVSANLSNHSSSKSANITMRVDHGRVKELLTAIEDYDGEISLSSHSRTAQDRTMEFQDISVRRDTQVALRDRLEDLVANYNYSITRDIGDLLRIEQEIARVQGQIESMDARIRGISQVTDRTTLHVSFRNQEAMSPVDVPYVKNAIKEVGDIFSRSVATVITVTAALIPNLVALIVFLFGAKYVLRFLFRGKKRTRSPAAKRLLPEDQS